MVGTMKNEYYEDWDSDEEIQFVQMINNQYHEWGIYSPYWALVTAFKIASHSFCMFLLLPKLIDFKQKKSPSCWIMCYNVC